LKLLERDWKTDLGVGQTEKKQQERSLLQILHDEQDCLNVS
jgi:hypothetical protein